MHLGVKWRNRQCLPRNIYCIVVVVEQGNQQEKMGTLVFRRGSNGQTGFLNCSLQLVLLEQQCSKFEVSRASQRRQFSRTLSLGQGVACLSRIVPSDGTGASG